MPPFKLPLRLRRLAIGGLCAAMWAAALAAADAPPAPPTPPVAPAAPAAEAGFHSNAILSDGTAVGPLWPGPAAGDNSGPVWKDPQGKTIAADKVVRVLLANTPPPTNLTQGATTFDGQRISGSIDAYSDKDGLKITSPVLGAVQIPAGLLSRVYIQETAGGEEDELPVGLTRPATDAAQLQKNLVVYRNADTAPSQLFFLAEGEAKLKSGDDITTAPLERLAFITLAAPAQPPVAARQLLVLLTDGTRVTGDVAAATPEQLTLNSTVGTLKIPRPLVHSLWPHRAGYRLLSKLPPVAVKNNGQFDVSFAPRVNRTAAGRPFQAAEFNLGGIGMHSYTRADYALAGDTSFVCFLTLDGAAPARAACTARIYVDGAKKFEADLTPKSGGRWISVPVTGGKMLSLEVDFGADQADTGDLVDWIDGVLLQ